MTIHRNMSTVGRLVALACIAMLAQGVAARDRANDAPSSEFSRERLERIRPFLQRSVDEGRIAGAVTLVLRDGVPLHSAVVGWADKEARRPMREDTLFRIASQTKALTSVAVLQLAEHGKLSLTQAAGDFITSFKRTMVAASESGAPATPASRPITIHDLLTHTAGISYGREQHIAAQYASKGLGSAAGHGWYFADQDATMCDAMERLGGLPFVAQPGTAFVYGYGTDVLGCIVERVSGLTLEQYFRTNILDPLDMRDTFFYVPSGQRERLAVVYGSVADKAVRSPDGALGQGHYLSGPRRAFSGGAGLISTARDYARFLEMIRRDGELDGKRILSPRAVALMHASQVELPWSDGLGFGYGFQITERYGASGMETEGTYGWAGAYGTSYRVDPQERLVIVFMIQLMPNETDVSERFSTLLYQALLESDDTP